HAATRNWKASPADNNLNNAANWDTLPVTGDTLSFPSSSITALNNNFPSATSFGGITFAAGSNSYTLSGNFITLTGNVTNSGTALQTFNFSIQSTAVTSFATTPGGGDIVVNGILGGTGGGVTVTGRGMLTLTAAN